METRIEKYIVVDLVFDVIKNKIVWRSRPYWFHLFRADFRQNQEEKNQLDDYCLMKKREKLLTN